jgi:predicted outer membrane lipoprotein
LLRLCYMAVTRAHLAERDQYLEQIDRLVNNHILHSSESLCKLLRYLAVHALAHPGVPLKEYEIATEVFHRPADFDPQLDSTIRVQAGRLRLKLAEYYGSEGAEDPILVDLPKGGYVLSFHHRTPPPHGGLMVASLSSGRRESAATSRITRNWAIAVIVLGILLAAAVAVIAAMFASRTSAEASATSRSEPVPAAFRTFWGSFIAGPEAPWVIFSNGAFVGRPETGMRYFDPARDSRELVLDHYTGVGEVLAVHDLDHVFAMLGRPILVKRGSLLSLDDAKNNNLIFLGSPAENLTLREIPSTQEFVFQRLTTGPRKGDLAIVNLHPQAGEPDAFLASASNLPLTEEYSVIARVREGNPAQSVMILAGTTTIGTQAAAEYVCGPQSLEDLLKRLGVSKMADLRPFEVVLRVKVTRGVPVAMELVALRKATL